MAVKVLQNIISYYFILYLCHRGISYKLYPALKSIIFTNILDTPDNVHSEYYFGKCASKYKTLLLHDTYTYDQVKNKIIIRKWMENTTEAANCVYIRATSHIGDIVRYHAFKFGMCVCWITYIHDGKIYRYYYYEWYMPVSMTKDITWDLFFYVYPSHQTVENEIKDDMY